MGRAANKIFSVRLFLVVLFCFYDIIGLKSAAGNRHGLGAVRRNRRDSDFADHFSGEQERLAFSALNLGPRFVDLQHAPNGQARSAPG